MVKQRVKGAAALEFRSKTEKTQSQNPATHGMNRRERRKLSKHSPEEIFIRYQELQKEVDRCILQLNPNKEALLLVTDEISKSILKKKIRTLHGIKGSALSQMRQMYKKLTKTQRESLVATK